MRQAMRQATHDFPGGKRRRAAALLLLLAALPAVCAAAEALECESCDVPTARALSFCADMVVFSACLPPGSTWTGMVRRLRVWVTLEVADA
jgi:hypothetical protein